MTNDPDRPLVGLYRLNGYRPPDTSPRGRRGDTPRSTLPPECKTYMLRDSVTPLKGTRVR